MVLDVITDNPVLAVIAAGEVGFWVLIGAGLAARYLIACGLILAMIVMVDSSERTGQLWTWLWRLATVLIIWFVGWPLWASLAQPARSGGSR